VDSLRGQLLVAAPSLFDPNFARAVVLVVEHSEAGAMGIVLNRPTEASVTEATPPFEGLVESDAVVWVGGPVEPTAVMVVAEFDDVDEAATLVFGDVGFLRGDTDPALANGSALRRARVFAGYAGWAESQLEAELEQEDWIVEPPEADDVFTVHPGGLWGTVLRRKGGHYALIAMMPVDPSVN
jgi:putative transcriptional regulator